ncbi:hypothetical protein ACC674_38555, partial [Rhizobium ruizarguesonis]
ERHWQMVTERLSLAVTRDISAIIEIIETYPQNSDYSEIVRIARDQLSLQFSSVGGRIGPSGRGAYSSAKFGVEGFSEVLAKE